MEKDENRYKKYVVNELQSIRPHEKTSKNSTLYLNCHK